MMTKRQRFALAALLSALVLMLSPQGGYAADSILGLLSRANTWTATQTFGDGVETVKVGTGHTARTTIVVDGNTGAAWWGSTIVMRSNGTEYGWFGNCASITNADDTNLCVGAGASGKGINFIVAGGTTYAAQLGATGGLTLGGPTGGDKGTGTLNTKTAYYLNGTLLLSSTAPTVSSGFGTSPSVTASNGPASFEVNVGTGGTASTGVITLPAAPTGWTCQATDITTKSSTVFITKQTASTTTSATFGNYNTSGAAAAWVASDRLRISCMPY